LNLKETEILLREMFAIDGRKIDADKIAAWKQSLGSIPLDVAQTALRQCRQDERINFVEPKHIVGKAKEAVAELNRQEEQEQRQNEPQKDTSPPPTCIHKKTLVECDICCKKLADFHATHDNGYDCKDTCLNYMRENLLA